MLDYVKILPNELKYTIFEYIDVDTRINLILKKYTINRLIQYFNIFNINDRIKCFKTCIEDKVVCKKKNGRCISLKNDLLSLLSCVTYINNRGITIKVNHSVCNSICSYSHLDYMPKSHGTWVPRNLQFKQSWYLNDQLRQLIPMFYSINFEIKDNNNKKFIYKIRCIILRFMLTMIIYGKTKWELKEFNRCHYNHKMYMKKRIFKILCSKARKYQRAYIKRSKEAEKLRIKEQKLLEKQKKKIAKEIKKGKKVIIKRKNIQEI